MSKLILFIILSTGFFASAAEVISVETSQVEIVKSSQRASLKARPLGGGRWSLDVPTRLRHLFRVGSLVELSSSVYKSQTRVGRVESLHPESAVISVASHLKPETWQPFLFYFSEPASQLRAVPPLSVASVNGESAFVLVVSRDSFVKKVEIEIVGFQSGKLLVIGDLTGEDHVVAKGLHRVRVGSQVKPIMRSKEAM